MTINWVGYLTLSDGSDKKLMTVAYQCDLCISHEKKGDVRQQEHTNTPITTKNGYCPVVTSKRKHWCISFFFMCVKMLNQAFKTPEYFKMSVGTSTYSFSSCICSFYKCTTCPLFARNEITFFFISWVKKKLIFLSHITHAHFI